MQTRETERFMVFWTLNKIKYNFTKLGQAECRLRDVVVT